MARTRPYVVRSGDYLSSIAYAQGVLADDIWQHPGNSKIRDLRKNQEMLAPGDVLVIPVPERKWLPVSVGTTNKFVATPPTVKVKLTLTQHDLDAQATQVAGLAYTVSGLPGPDLTGSIGGDGTVSFDVPVQVKQVMLTIDELGIEIPVQVGGMDPVEEPSGVRQRLTHLGYLDDASPNHPLDGALAAFQTDQKLPATGVADDATNKALVAANGS